MPSYGTEICVFQGETGLVFTRPTSVAEVRVNSVRLDDELADDDELRIAAVVILSRDGDGEIVRIGFAVERRDADGSWRSIMANLDDAEDAGNVEIVEELFGASVEEELEMVSRARAAQRTHGGGPTSTPHVLH